MRLTPGAPGSSDFAELGAGPGGEAARGPLGFPWRGAGIREGQPAMEARPRGTTGEIPAARRHASCVVTVVMNRAHANLAPVAAAILALLALLGPSVAQAGPAEERAAAQAELTALAPRIEQLKRDSVAGQGGDAELLRLLARAQALAALLAPAPATPPAPRAAPAEPDAQELRERADALRDQADKAAAGLAEVERRLTELAQRAELLERLDALGAAADIFAVGAGRRAATGAARATETSVTPGSGSTGPTGSQAGAADAPALRAAAEPGRAGLVPGPEDAGALRRRRTELTRALAALRAEAGALDAEALAAEGR